MLSHSVWGVLLNYLTDIPVFTQYDYAYIFHNSPSTLLFLVTIFPFTVQMDLSYLFKISKYHPSKL